VVVSLWAVSAIALDPSLKLSQYQQRRWTSKDGLPQSSVKTITQTSDGYLWIGTEQGLVRFDGVRFVTVDLTIQGKPPVAYIQALAADGTTVWIGTGSGLYRLSTHELMEVDDKNGEPIVDVKDLLRARSDFLWVGADKGLYKVEGDRTQAVKVLNSDKAGIESLTESTNGRLCFAAAQAVCYYDKNIEYLSQINDAAAPRVITQLGFDAADSLWAGTAGNGLIHLSHGDIHRYSTATGLPHNWVQALFVDSTGSVWIGFGSGEGVARIGPHGLELLPTEDGRADAGVAVFEDREGNIWIGTNGGGLIRLTASQVVPFSIGEGLRDRFVQSVLEDHEGVIWIGTRGGGLHRLVAGKVTAYTHKDGLTSPDVISLAEDRQGRLWVGTGGAGAFVRQGERFVPVGGSREVIFSLHEDHQGQLWAGGVGGVLKLEGGRFQEVEPLRGWNSPAIASGPDGKVYFTNVNGGGIAVWDHDKITKLVKEQGINSDMTIALYIEADGGVWIGTHLGGLIFLSGERISTFTTANGLCDNSVFTLTEGPSGKLWMSSNLGVFAVDKAQLKAVAKGQLAKVDCRLFGTADGMRSSECNGGQQPAAWRDHDDRLWFATTDGVVRIDPRELAPPDAGPVLVEELSSGTSSLQVSSQGQHLELGPEQRDLEIRYTALSLKHPELLRFRYQLEGFDRNWVEAGQRRVAYYTNLPPRQYRFRVQAQMPGGPWSEQGASLSLSLTPQFHETRWFLALVLLGLASVGFVAHRGRVAVMRRRACHLEQLVKERTRELAEVNSTLEQRIEEGIAALRESDRMAAFGHLVAGVAHEVRHPIFALRTAAHLLTQELAVSDKAVEALDIMQRETERMNQLIDDLLELARPRELELSPWPPQELVDEALASIACNNNKALRFTKEVEGSTPAVLADRPAIIQVLVNLLGNACRHALGARKVTVGAHLDAATNRVLLTVADDGQGISVVDQAHIFEPFFSGAGGTGLGLAIAARLVREHQGTLSVDSTEGVGSVFTIALKLAPEPS